MKKNLFDDLEEIYSRPEPFAYCTVSDLWTDEYTSRQMLKFHLDPNSDLASRKHSFIDRSAEWVTRRFGLGPGKSVIDLGCGPGLYTQRLAKSGARITGVDFSSSSIRFARKSALSQKLKINYLQQDYLTLKLTEKFDLAMMIYCDYCALSPDQRKQLLEVVCSLLKPGGSLLLDLHSYSRFDEIRETRSTEQNDPGNFWSAGGNLVFQNTYKYEVEHVTLDKYTIIEPSRTRVIYNWLAHFTSELIRTEFEGAGLLVTEVLGNTAGDEYDPIGSEFAVIASPD